MSEYERREGFGLKVLLIEDGENERKEKGIGKNKRKRKREKEGRYKRGLILTMKICHVNVFCKLTIETCLFTHKYNTILNLSNK